MTLVPDKSYIESTHFDALRSNYKQWQKGYSGYVFYHTLDGKFNNGWKFENGKVTMQVTQYSDTGLNLNMGMRKKSKADYCIDTNYFTYSQNCTDWYSNSEYITSTCGDWYLSSSYTITECYNDGNSSGNNNNNNSSNNGDYIPYENPIRTYKTNPCLQVVCLNADYGLQTEDNRLLALATSTIEYGSFMKLNDDSPLSSIYNYIPLVGSPSTNTGGSIDISSYLQSNEKIDGFAHTHYNGLIPMFSADDINAIYLLDASGHINDLSMFTTQVVTSQGVWTLKIDDINQFKSFCQNNINTAEKRTSFNNQLMIFDMQGKSEESFLAQIANSGMKLFVNPVNNGAVIFSASGTTLRTLSNGSATSTNCY